MDCPRLEADFEAGTLSGVEIATLFAGERGESPVVKDEEFDP